MAQFEYKFKISSIWIILVCLSRIYYINKQITKMILRIIFKMLLKLKMKQKGIFKRSFNLWLICLGVFLFSTGCLLLLNFELLYNFIIKSVMRFSETSDAFNAWRTNDPPLIMDIYFFNWTNAEELYDSDITPHFEQVGPYRFKEVKEKVNITFNSNDTVSYSYVKYYYFMNEESPRQLTDVINTINPVSLTAAYRFRDASYIWKKSLSLSLATMSSVYVQKSIDELLFTGFKDGLLNTLKHFTDVSDRFGWLYKRNGTISNNMYNMYTKNDEKFGTLLTWNYANKTTFYDDSCNDIKGSAGEFYPMNRERDQITLYSGEMCTFTNLNYVNDVNIKGINAYKYAPLHIFDNGTNIPKNKCFCVNECIPSGVLDISKCRENSPVFLSLPHFYGADPYYTNIIDGLKPEKEKHEFYITLEPKSAIAVDVAARMQINMRLEPIEYITMYENVPKIYVPIFFIDQVVLVNDELAPKIMLLQNLPNLNVKMAIGVIAVGAILTFVTVLLMVCRNEAKDEEKEKEKKDISEEVPLNSYVLKV